nr:hypothetical protein [Tanacetum cinerariifolium]
MNVGNEELKECLDKEDNCSGDANINKDNCEKTVIIGDDNANSSNEDVNVVNDKSGEEISKEKIDMQSTRKSGNNVVKLVDIVNLSKLDNKLLSVPTQISETGNEMVIFDDEIIELGSKKWNLTVCGQFIGCSMGFNKARIGFARVLVEIDAEKGIKDKIEIIYESKNVVEGTKKAVDVEIPCICSKCKVFGHTDSYCKIERKNVDDTGNVKTNENEFKVMHNRKYGREGSNMYRRTYMQKGQYGRMKNEGKYVNKNNRWQPNYTFEFKIRDDGIKGKSVNVSMGKYIETNKRNNVNEKTSGGNMERKDSKMDNGKNEDVLVENFGMENAVLRNEVKRLDKVYSEEKNGENFLGMERRKLWKDLETQKIVTCETPWVIMGDFNVTLKVSQHLNRRAFPSSEMIDFQDCINNIEVDDLHSEVKIPNGVIKKKGSFRFSNFITEKEDFLPIVKSVWDKRFESHTTAEKLREKVRESHKEVDMFPHDENVKEKSCRILKEYYEAMKEENNLLCQKAKVEWLREGDRNTTYFYKTIKKMVHRGRIMTIGNEERVRFESKDVAYQIFKHFEEFLGKSSLVHDLTCRSEIFINKLNPEEAERMVRPISESEIKNAMFKIDDSKAPGPDGYTSRFYKSAWSIVGNEISQAINDFFSNGKLLGEVNAFSNGKLLGEVNATLISLVPKIPTPDKVSYFRPIACYNVLYKCIIRIIKKSLDEFNGYSRLLQNMQKSTIFFGGLSSAEQNNILSIIPFTFGKLPVRYLGVPLITKQISINDCKPLMSKFKDKINNWKNKSLSYAGRVQLIAYVLSFMQNYWASVFLLPKQVIYEINKVLKGFMWCQYELTKGKAKVSWDAVCKPKDQGGLGLKNLGVWNEVLMVKH